MQKKPWDWKNRQRRRQWWKIITQRLYTKVRACLSWALQPLLSFKGKLLQGKKIAWFQSGRKVRCTCGAGYCSGHASVIAFFPVPTSILIFLPWVEPFFHARWWNLSFSAYYWHLKKMEKCNSSLRFEKFTIILIKILTHDISISTSYVHHHCLTILQGYHWVHFLKGYIRVKVF